MAFASGMKNFTFRVSYETQPDDPAIITLGGQQTLDDLHWAIQHAFDWDGDHLYSFFMSGKPWDRKSEYAATSGARAGERLAAQAQIESLKLKPGQSFLYLFDYGDEHYFTVQLQEATPALRPLSQARVERSPTSPPEQYPDFDEAEDDDYDEEDDDDDGLTTQDILDEIEEINQRGDAEDLFDWGGDGHDLHSPVRAHVEAALVPSSGDYPPPLDQILEWGDQAGFKMADHRIVQLRLNQSHVPDLVRMARDRALNTAWGDTPQVWAPVHALYALQTLDVAAFVPELVPLFDLDDDWHPEVLEKLLGQTGEAAIAPVRDYLQDRTRWVYGRAAAADTLRQIATQHPHLRPQVVEILTDEVWQAEENDEELNGYIVADLIDLGAQEALPAIRHAYEADVVADYVVGAWADVMKDLGLTPEPGDPLLDRPIRNPFWPFVGQGTEEPEVDLPVPSPSKSSSKPKKKAKRKMVAASRKTNRTKKKKRKK